LKRSERAKLSFYRQVIFVCLVFFNSFAMFGTFQQHNRLA
jgi:hypothetical protein